MGTIHFVSGLESLTLKALKDAEDCADILKDLGRIKYTIAHGSEQEARALDYELQQKYPAIDAMLQAADNLQATRIRCRCRQGCSHAGDAAERKSSRH